MSEARETSKDIKVYDYSILGNTFRLWRNADGETLFVIDDTITEYKPNVMLVLPPDEDNRKWDDVLQNDFGIDLETVRPKKNNKYQKLDIEYASVDVYDALVRAFENGGDVVAAMTDVIDFRFVAARRSATERLAAANEALTQGQDTLEKTNETIAGLKNRQAALKTKLKQQRKSVGREPTKQSASKILKTESLIDSGTEKLKRAERRATRAQRRVENAKREIADLEYLLALEKPNLEQPETVGLNVATVVKNETKTQEKKQTQTEVKDMADNETEEVKPLFDKDPEILDEDIAFKPIEFDDIDVADSKESETTESETEHVSDSGDAVDNKETFETDGVAKPLDFVIKPDVFETEETTEIVQNEKTTETAPVLESISSVETPVAADVDTTGNAVSGQYENVVTPPRSEPSVVAPVGYSRPVSPITGDSRGVSNVQPGRSKPTFAYYVLLIVLIVLSVFTLWLYQKKNGGGNVNIIETPVVTPEPEPEPIVVAPEPEPIVEPEPEPEPIVVPEPEPEPEPIVEPEPEPEPIVEPEPEPERPATNLIAPDVIIDDEPIVVPEYPVYGPQQVQEDEYTDDYDYDVDEPVYISDQPVYVPEPVYVSEQAPVVVTQEPKKRPVAKIYRDPKTNRYISIEDGGQYSVIAE